MDLKEKFLTDSIWQLKKEESRIREVSALSDELRNRLFRIFHTIKGGAQVFGLEISARLAHQLENLISKESIEISELTKEIKNLITALNGENVELKDLDEEVRLSDLSFLPDEIISRLTKQELDRITEYRNRKKFIAVVRRKFNSENLLEELREFCGNVSSYGELIATLPLSPSDFYFIVAFSREVEAFDLGAEIISNIAPESNVQLVVRQILRHAEDLARRSDKKITFESKIQVDDIPEHLAKLIFDILLHLVRNAVDHGIDERGKICILIEKLQDGISLKVSDDGRGIDLEKLRTEAIKKGLLSESGDTMENLVDFIFFPGISTVNELSEISGRGVGLDSVKRMIEDVGGTIKVMTGSSGTTFEIFIRNNSSLNDLNQKNQVE
ncbi:MAG: hypothetical protein D6735_05775 [Acidobacteria bacterium]|nr:MAG: hypothetical protein D6735_05775 [Acidobacteriota bacterium]